MARPCATIYLVIYRFMFYTVHLHWQNIIRLWMILLWHCLNLCGLILIQTICFVVKVLTFGFVCTCRALANVAANGGDHRWQFIMISLSCHPLYAFSILFPLPFGFWMFLLPRRIHSLIWPSLAFNMSGTLMSLHVLSLKILFISEKPYRLN